MHDKEALLVRRYRRIPVPVAEKRTAAKCVSVAASIERNRREAHFEKLMLKLFSVHFSLKITLLSLHPLKGGSDGA